MPVEVALVVDDSKSARVMLSRLLQKTGLSVDLVESGEEAIEYLQSHSHPDVIFMDHMMPGMDGLATTKKITANQSTSSIPVIMYTSKEGADYEQEVYQNGAFGILSKPAKPAVLKGLLVKLQEREAALANGATADSVEEEGMSKEMIEEVSSIVVAKALEERVGPISSLVSKIENSIGEYEVELKRLTAQKTDTSEMVTQPILEAKLQQSSLQMQQQMNKDLKSVMDKLEEKKELDTGLIEQIRALAESAGASAASVNSEKIASKVAVEQTQVQMQQEFAKLIDPLSKQLRVTQVLSLIAIVASGAAIVMQLV